MTSMNTLNWRNALAIHTFEGDCLSVYLLRSIKSHLFVKTPRSRADLEARRIMFGGTWSGPIVRL